MIKLQLLLRHPHCTPDLDPALHHRLDALGMHVTGSGQASVSAEVTPDTYRRLFGSPPPIEAGCMADVQAAPSLPVPRELEDAITLITIAAHHVSTP